MDNSQICKEAYLQYNNGQPCLELEAYKFVCGDNPEKEFFVPQSQIETLLTSEENQNIYVECDGEVIRLIFRNTITNQDSEEGSFSQTLPIKSNWNEDNSKLLISLYKQFKDKICLKKKLWAKITELINERHNNFTSLQVENRFKTLERAYKRKIENNNLTGRGRANCPFEKELDDIFMKNSAIFPEAVASVSTVTHQADIIKKLTNEESNVSSQDVSEDEMEKINCDTNKRKALSSKSIPKPKKRIGQVLTELTNELKVAENAAQRRHEEKIQIMLARNKMLEKKNNLLE